MSIETLKLEFFRDLKSHEAPQSISNDARSKFLGVKDPCRESLPAQVDAERHRSGLRVRQMLPLRRVPGSHENHGSVLQLSPATECGLLQHEQSPAQALLQ